MLKSFVPLALAAAAAVSLLAPVGPAGADPVVMPGLEERTIVSKAGLPYRIFIAVPREPPPAAGYPVAYVLDGNSVAGTLADIARTQTRGQGGLMEPALLVAIGYPGDEPIHMKRRALDLTSVKATPQKGSWTYLTPEGTGGADAFLGFIEDELKPAIAASFEVDPARQALMGHSFGGLFTLHALFTRPAAFSTYVAASPSLWWADAAMLKEADGLAGRLPKPPRRVLITVGAYEQDLHPALRGRPDSDAVARKLAERQMVDSARTLAGQLSALPGAPLHVTFSLIAGQTHGSAAPYALLMGLAAFLGPDGGPAEEAR